MQYRDQRSARPPVPLARAGHASAARLVASHQRLDLPGEQEDAGSAREPCGWRAGVQLKLSTLVLRARWDALKLVSVWEGCAYAFL